MRRYLVTGLAMVCVVVGLAGCSGGAGIPTARSSQASKFKASYLSTVAWLKQDGRAIGAAVSLAGRESDAQLAVTLRRLAARVQGHLSQLETLRPPERLAADFNSLTGAVTRIEADLNAAVVAIAIHSKTAGEQAGGSIVIDSVAAQNADARIRRALGIR